MNDVWNPFYSDAWAEWRLIACFEVIQVYDPLVKDLITLKQAASHSKLSIGYLRSLARRGRLQAIKKGRIWLTTKEAVDQFLAEN